MGHSMLRPYNFEPVPYIVSVRGFLPENPMQRSVQDILNLYDPSAPLEQAYTIPAPWYRDARVEGLERRSVFRATWQIVGRVDQVRDKGQFFTADVANEPIVVVRGDDGQLRAFYNVCRHHA